jgi:hypothetical protein
MTRGVLLALVLAVACGPDASAKPPTRLLCSDGLRVAKVNGVKRRGVCDLDEAATAAVTSAWWWAIASRAS